MATPKILSDAVNATPGVAREALLGTASGAGLPESTDWKDYTTLPGLWHMISHPIDSAKLVGKPIWQAHEDEFNEAQREMNSPGAANKFSGLVHGVAAAVPLIGPTAERAGEEIGQGIANKDAAQTAYGVGSAAGTILTLGMGRGGAPEAQLAGEHPAVGQLAAAEHASTGGSTFNPRTGRNIAGTNNYAVGIAPEHTAVSNRPFTPEEYNNYVAAHRDVLTRNPNLQVGTWADNTGLHHMDLTATTPNKSAAVQMAKQMNQTAIYHLGRGEEVPTGGTGEPVNSPFSVDFRAQALAAATPEKKPFYGYHLSNEKLDYLDPNRRGIPAKGQALPVGQEAARLNLKSQFGVGENAPGGVYAYSSGTRPEPAIAGRKFSHDVRGQFAIADINDPKFQNAADAAYSDALQKTGNNTLAQYAAANAKELAIRDAGYDGYTAQGTGINFLFEGQPTQLTGAPVKDVELPGGQLAAEAGLARTEALRKGLGGKTPEAAAQPSDVAAGKAPQSAQADPWANLKYDRQATDQATAESQNGLLPQGMTVVQRAQQIKEQLLQGGHAGNGVTSDEEINRAGKNFLIDRNGKLTYHGKAFAPEETQPGGAHVTVMDDGSYRLNEGTDLNPAQKNSLQSAANELKIQNLRPQETGASFPGEKAESVQNGDPLNLLSETERNQAMTKRLGNQFSQVLRKLPEVQDFESAARKGAIGRNWYQRSIEAFDAMRNLAPDYFQPQDADRWANVVAATSPQQGVPLNLREALTFWKEWHDAGRPTSIGDIQKAMKNGDIRPLTNQPSKLPNLVRALNDQDLLPGDKKAYYKVGNFGKNLSNTFGNVTLDSWMGNFAGVNERQMPKPQFYHALALRTRQAAQKLGWHPAEAQAAIWTFTKTLAEMSGWKAAGGTYYRPTEMLDRLTPDKMKAYSNDFADIMRTDPEVRAKLSELGVDINELDKRLKNISPKPSGEAIEGSDQEAATRSLKRNAGRIGKKQRNLEGFTTYSRPPAQSELDDLGEPEEGDTSFSFGGPLAAAVKASSRK